METGAALQLSAILLFIIGIVHSVLGERYILLRLFRRGDLPKLFGGVVFTKNTLRFAWHLTTIAWWGFAALLLLLANPPVTESSVTLVIGLTFLAHAIIAMIASRGKHLAWLVFLIIGILTIYVSYS